MKRYHFIGIGGMGMGTLASLMLAKGYQVTGSDLKENELIRQLREKGAKIHIGHSVANVKGADYVIYSSAIKMNNPEMIEATIHQIPTLRRAEMLAQLVNKEIGITVAGAHGKTTTSSMIAYILIAADLKPTTAIGGIVNDGSYGAALGKGKYMVAEVDESDGSFLCFTPHFSVITNMDHEHLDYYKDWTRLKESFVQFANKTAKTGSLIVCGDDDDLMEVVSEVERSRVTYGLSKDNDFRAENIKENGFQVSFDCFYKTQKLGRVELNLSGRHNIVNALAAIAVAHLLSVDFEVSVAALGEFTGVKRRLERKGEVNNVLVLDDYAHHPTEIAATLQAVDSLMRDQTIVIFQPHRYSRTNLLFSQFIDILQNCKNLILLDVYPASEKPTDGLTTKDLVEELKKNHCGSLFHLTKEEAVSHVIQRIQPRGVVITLGAGDITLLSDRLLNALRNKERSMAKDKESVL